MSGSNYTVGLIADQIASSIGLCWPNDESRIFENLTHVQNEIWKSGKFFGSTKFFDCKVLPNNQIITPHGYGIMLGIDINGKPKEMKDEFFLFHKNGPGDINRFRGECENFNDDIYYLGNSPVLIQPTDESCRQFRLDCEPKKIIVRCECANDPPYKRTVISGLGVDGKPIYTYKATDPSTEQETVCQCTSNNPVELQAVQAVQGVEYQISSYSLAANILFSKIDNIIKEVTSVPVEYWMVDQNGIGTLIARLEPWQILSNYQIYQIPKKCLRMRSVLGLFKRNKPEPVIDENQIFISSDIEAIKSLAIGIDYKYTKKNIPASLPFFQDAGSQLSAELKENRTGATQTLQVENKQGYAKFPKM